MSAFMDLALLNAPGAPDRFAVRSRVTAFIDNAFLAAGPGRLLPVIYPATEEQVSAVEEADAAVVDRAVAAARRAFDHGPWPRMGLDERQALLRRLASLIRDHAEELAYLECLNSGIPMRHLANGQIPGLPTISIFSPNSSAKALDRFTRKIPNI